MSGGSAFWSHLVLSYDTAAGPAGPHGPQADPDAPALRAPAVDALRALVALAAADGVRVDLEVPATGDLFDGPASCPSPSAWVRGPGGVGVGVHAHEGESEAEEAARAADSVHESLVEWMPGLGRSTSWPPCPLHPETHPRALVPGDDGDDDGDGDARPRWTCPRTGDVLGRLG